MVGGTVDECSVSELGLVGDRVWAVRDLENGGIRGAKKFGGLMKLSASFVKGSDDVSISLPSGRVVRSDDMMEELRNVFGRDIDEPLPDFSVFPPEVMEFESPPGTYYDCWPLMIMSTSALRSMQQALPDSQIDIRRFRPSLVIDTGDQTGHPEFSWAGKTARIGDCEIEFQSACPRCVMVTREVGDDLPADRAILRHIVRELDQNVGVYAKVTQPGAIKTTDQLTFLS
jgi:uncharacterized protein YcbX